MKVLQNHKVLCLLLIPFIALFREIVPPKSVENKRIRTLLNICDGVIQQKQLTATTDEVHSGKICPKFDDEV